MKPRIEQAGLFDAPAWEQEAAARAEPAPAAAKRTKRKPIHPDQLIEDGREDFSLFAAGLDGRRDGRTVVGPQAAEQVDIGEAVDHAFDIGAGRMRFLAAEP